MFDDSGRKIMGLATIGFVIMSAIVAILTLIAMSNARSGAGLLLIVGVVTIFAIYVGFLTIHAFGELVQETRGNRLLNERVVKLLKEISEENKKLTALLAAKEEPAREDAGIKDADAPAKESKSDPNVAGFSKESEHAAVEPAAAQVKIVKVDRRQKNVTCPYCGTVQLANRRVCYCCGALFVDKEL